MAWVKLDDGFYDNPKILAVGLAAAGLYAAALSYAGRKLTDGFVPDVAVWMLTGGEEDGAELPKFLVNHGLWTVVPGGYQIHDFLEYNPPASKVKSDRAAAKERMRAQRSENVRPNNERSSAEVREMFATPVPVPVPVPGSVPERENLSLATLACASTSEFDEFWKAYPRRIDKKKAQRAWAKLRPPPLKAILDALTWQRDLPDWRKDHGDFVPYPATYLNGRRWEDERPPDPMAAMVARFKAEEAAR